MGRLHLHVPAYDELWYRKRLMEDPATMSYNRGYDLPFDGYQPETGCIAFPEAHWRSWYERWVHQEPERFYAYIVRSQDGAFLGEVNVHRSPGHDWYEMGIVLEACYRGQGYAQEALELLLHHAFDQLHAPAVHNNFESEREAAVRLHLNAGFTVYRRHENGLLELLISLDQFR